MSWTTDILLNIGPDGDERIEEVNTYFEEIEVDGLVWVNAAKLPIRWYGGDQVFEAQLYVGAVDDLELDSLVKHLKSVPWEYPEAVQLFVKGPEDLAFRVITLI